MARVALELLPQMPYVDVDRARIAVIGASQSSRAASAAVDAPWMRDEHPQQLELDVRQPDLLAATSTVRRGRSIASSSATALLARPAPPVPGRARPAEQRLHSRAGTRGSRTAS